MRASSWEYAVREALNSIRRNGLMSVASVSTVAISLLVLAVFLLVAVNLEHAAMVVESQLEIKAYVDEKASSQAIGDLQRKISSLAGVAGVEYVSKVEALDRLRAQLKDRADLLEGVEEINPLRDSFEVQVVRPEYLRRIAEQVTALPGIANVVYGEELAGKIIRLTRALRLAGLGLAVMLAVATVFIISNTIRLTVFARRREIGIMKLVGATDSFIRWPFILEGMFLGLVGSLVSTSVVWRGYAWLVVRVRDTLPFIPVVPGRPVLPGLTLMMLALGAFIGALGSAISLRRFLRV